MVNTKEQKINGTRMYLGTIVDSAESIIKLIGNGALELGEGQEVIAERDLLIGTYYSFQGRYQIRVRKIK